MRAAAAALALTLVALAGCGGSDTTTGSTGSTTTGPSGAPATTTTTAPQPVPCPPEDGSAERRIDFATPPPRCLDPDATYVATLDTTEGTIVVELDTERTPRTADNFATLARYRYYDDTRFVRTADLSGFVQGGAPHTQDVRDPGPGYTLPDEGTPFTADDYRAGAIGMLKERAEDSEAGQFFLLSRDDPQRADPAERGDRAGRFIVFGRVVDGLDVVAKIAALDDGTGEPTRDARLRSVTISER